MKFKPEDFGGQYGAVQCAAIANAKLQEWLANTTDIYGTKEEFLTGIFNRNCPATHKGKLVCIEELVKNPCKHTVAMHRLGQGSWELCTEQDGKIVCGKCGVELDLEWKEKK